MKRHVPGAASTMHTAPIGGRIGGGSCTTRTWRTRGGDGWRAGRGRDLERLVLAQAVRWHLQGRVLAYGNKTVVFD